MIRFLSDENFDNRIIRGLLRRLPDIDIVRVQDVGLIKADDRRILDWAACSLPDEWNGQVRFLPLR